MYLMSEISALLKLSPVFVLLVISHSLRSDAVISTEAISQSSFSTNGVGGYPMDNNDTAAINNIGNNSNNSSNNNSHQTQYYACTNNGDSVRCDPSVSEISSYLVDGFASELYVPSANLSFVEGRHGMALALDANRRESIEINNTSSINPQNFSVTFWAKRLPHLDQSAPVGVIVSHANDSNTAGWYFRVIDRGKVSFAVTNSGGNITDTKVNNDTQIPTDRFTLITGTFDGSKVRLYMDGRLASEAIFAGTYIADPKTPLRLGGVAASMGTLLWTGIIDSFSIFNQTLTEDQIRGLFRLGETKSPDSEISRYLQSRGLVSSWNFDNNLNDTSPSHQNSNNGVSRTVIASMAFAPDGRLFFSEKNTGNLRIMKDDKVLERPFATISDFYIGNEQGLLGLAIDPLYEKNHYVYLYYTAIANNTIDNENNKIINRLVRFTDVYNLAVDKVTLLDNIPALAGYHSGGALAFGPDDKLYITVGDATTSIFAQNPSVLLGKVLRINRDGTIPADNPFSNSPVYTFGHRNMYGIAFDNKNDFGIITENGDVFYDEINLIKKGGNYGYPTLQPPNVAPEKANSSLSILPLRSYWDTVGPTQAIYYGGDKFSDLKDRFLVGGFEGSIYALSFDLKDGHIAIQEKRISFDIYPFSAITSVAASPDGEIYFAGSAIYKLTGIDYTQKEQTVFPIEIDFSTQFNDIKNMEIPKEGNRILIDFNSSGRNAAKTPLGLSSPSLLFPSSSSFPSQTLTVKIPKGLLHEVENVTALVNVTDNLAFNDRNNNIDYTNNPNSTIISQPINYTIDSSNSRSITIKIKHWPDTDYHLEINGANLSDSEIDSKFVIINFDDSHESQTKYAKPILDKYGFKATFFEVCNRLNDTDWQNLSELQRDGMDIQSHTMTHANLNNLSTTELEFEIGQAKQCFLDHGINSTVFAYPWGRGSDNATVVNTVAKYYDLARTDSNHTLASLDCDIWKDLPSGQSDCRTYDADGNLTLANRYSINSWSHKHIGGSYSYDTLTCMDNNCRYYNSSQMFERFVADVNSQTKYNKDGIPRAIPIFVYHSFVPLADVSDSIIPVDTTPHLFEREMKYLHDNDFNVITMADLGYDEKSNLIYVKRR